MEHPRDRRREALASAVEAGLAGQDDDTHTAMFMDLDVLSATINALKRAPFPPGTLHTFAVKANPVGRVLEVLRDAGLGAEVASLGELRQALGCGFPPERVVFDSPIKTVAELRLALQAGVRLNLDNLQELQRVADLVAVEPQLMYGNSSSTTGAGDGRLRLIGLRINPQVGEGSIRALSTGGRVSKFGIPLLERRTEVVAAFGRYPWLNALHLHVGSQGVPLELTVEGIARVAELAEEIEAAAAAYGTPDGNVGDGAAAAASVSRRVLALDIGGGLPVQYGNDDLSWLLGGSAAAAAIASTAAAAPEQDGAPTATTSTASTPTSIFERYAALLKARLPSLFATAATGEATALQPPPAPAPPPPPQLVTEFGRCLVAKAVFAAGRVEYAKRCGGRRVVVSGLGGDLLLRAVYLPETWPVRVELYGPAGQGEREPAAPGAGANGADGAQAGSAAAAEAAEGQVEDEGWLGATDVVGPLCFQGDRLAEAVPLPPAAPGDWVVVPDVGAYCLSMYSRYNSRCSPPVYGFRRRRCSTAAEAGAQGEQEAAGALQRGLTLPAAWAGGLRRCGGFEFVLLRRGETVEEVMAFWNLQ